jgi:hypothetical protein
MLSAGIWSARSTHVGCVHAREREGERERQRERRRARGRSPRAVAEADGHAGRFGIEDHLITRDAYLAALRYEAHAFRHRFLWPWQRRRWRLQHLAARPPGAATPSNLQETGSSREERAREINAWGKSARAGGEGGVEGQGKAGPTRVSGDEKGAPEAPRKEGGGLPSHLIVTEEPQVSAEARLGRWDRRLLPLSLSGLKSTLPIMGLRERSAERERGVISHATHGTPSVVPRQVGGGASGQGVEEEDWGGRGGWDVMGVLMPDNKAGDDEQGGWEHEHPQIDTASCVAVAGSASDASSARPASSDKPQFKPQRRVAPLPKVQGASVAARRREEDVQRGAGGLAPPRVERARL